MIKRFITGLILGLIGTICIVQHDPWIHSKLTKWLTKELARSFDCEVSLSVTGADIIFPALVLSNLSMQAHDGSWHWDAERYATGFSWIQFISSGMIDLWASVRKVDAFTTVENGKAAIVPHLIVLMKGPDLPVPAYVSYLDFKQGFVTIMQDAIKSDFWWDCIWRQQGDKKVSATINCTDGSLSYNGKPLIETIKGSLLLEKIRTDDHPMYRMRIESKGDLLHLGEYKTCVLSGNWHAGHGRFQLHSADHSLRMHPLIIKEKKDGLFVDGTASIPLTLLYRIAYGTELSSPIQGTCSIKINGLLGEHGSLSGHLICDDIAHSWFSDPIQLTATFAQQAQDWRAQWTVESGISLGLYGAVKWLGSEQQSTFFMRNSRACTLPHIRWQIPEEALTIGGTYNKKMQTATASYDCSLQSSLGESYALHGLSCCNSDLLISADGSIGSYQYHLEADGKTQRVKTLYALDGFKKERLEVKSDESGRYSGSIDYSLIQKACSSFCKYDTQGEGMLAVKIRKDENEYIVNFSLENGTIRLPQTYNFMNGLSGTISYNPIEQKIKGKEITCSLHTGSLCCPEGAVWIDAQKGVVPFAHIPIFINRCLVTAKQDLFAMVSGDLLITKKNNELPHIDGHLILNRAQLKENLFSEQLQKKLFQAAGSMHDHKTHMPFSCDITLESKDPVRVDTNFLQANAHLSLVIKGTGEQPMIEGVISVPSGSLAFPYKPLMITKGAITFVKEQPFNPLVELTAKNSVKNHAITLNIQGSLQNHMVLLESTPPLSEEQIVGLLIAGAHDETLDAVIPALLMQNVTNFLFSSHKLNFFDHYIKPWMKQINVTLTPKFGDQDGRGGLRGALEITVNDRWRALIEKNFSLTEDTNFELEYILSDDITFRVLRDERRDIGGEVEMKFKF